MPPDSGLAGLEQFAHSGVPAGWHLAARPATHGTLVPVVIAAMLVGELLHHHVNEARFRQAVFVVLWFTGVILAWP